MPSIRGVVNFFVKNGALVPDPALGRQATENVAGTISQQPDNMAVLRVPKEPVSRRWDHFVPFDFGPLT